MTVLVSSHRLLRTLPKGPSHAKYTAASYSSHSATQHAQTFTETPAVVCRLPSADKAAFAVTSRLLSSIVTEGLLPAVYVPLDDSSMATGVCVILAENRTLGPLRAIDVYAVVPVHHQPLLRPREATTSLGRSVWLLDPFDMLPCVLEPRDCLFLPGQFTEDLQSTIVRTMAQAPWHFAASHVSFTETLDPVHLWNKFAKIVGIDESLRTGLGEELYNSLTYQKVVYDRLPRLPSALSPPIEWEQSLIEGHPTHPSHRARRTIPPLPPTSPTTHDWYHPIVRFALIPRQQLDIYGAFEDELSALVSSIAERCGKQHIVSTANAEGKVLMPFYGLQLPNILEKFGDEGVEILDEDFSTPALGQASLRTVALPDYPSILLKLSVGITVSSALRTISHFTANIGPRLSNLIPMLAIDKEILYVEQEVASAVCMRTKEGKEMAHDVVKHLTAVVRRPYETQPGEAVILTAALVEYGHEGAQPGVSVVEHLFGLDTHLKKVAFFEDYTRLLMAAMLPPMLHNGLAFEAHPQNTLVRIAVRPPSEECPNPSAQVLGFVIRDLGGIRVHPPTLNASLASSSPSSPPFEFLPEHCIVTSTVQEAAKKLYHTLIHNQLQRLIRVLGLHYDGRGWDIVRRDIERNVGRDTWLWKVWMEGEGGRIESVQGKCLLRMKMQGLYRDSVYEDFPNLIQFRPDVADEVV